MKYQDIIHLRQCIRPSSSFFEKIFKWLSNKRLMIAEIIINMGLSPNIISISGASLCIFAGFLAAIKFSLLFVSLFFLIGSMTDAIDGTMASITGGNLRSCLGGMIDSLSDKVGEIGLLIGLILRQHDVTILRLIAFAGFLGLLSSYVKALAYENHLELNWSEVKLFGRATRIVILVIGLIFSGLIFKEEIFGIKITFCLLAIFNAFILTMRILRVIYAGKNKYYCLT